MKEDICDKLENHMKNRKKRMTHLSFLSKKRDRMRNMISEIEKKNGGILSFKNQDLIVLIKDTIKLIGEVINLVWDMPDERLPELDSKFWWDIR